jgi:DNA-binding PadR family transcriptional regulator
MKELEKLAAALNLLTDPDNWKIVIMLKAAGKFISYSEIYREMKKHFGENYNPNRLWRNLKKLEEVGLIKSERKLHINPNTGKTSTCFYIISDYGKKVIDEYLEKIFSIITKSP